MSKGVQMSYDEREDLMIRATDWIDGVVSGAGQTRLSKGGEASSCFE